MLKRLVALISYALTALLLIVVSGCAYQPKVQAVLPPVVFVHGEGASAAYWQDMVWRFESNGWSRARLFALQQPYPLAREVDGKEQPGRSSDAELLTFLRDAVDKVLTQTDAKQVMLVGQGRGALAIRNYILNAGGDQTVSHAVLAGVDAPWTGKNNKLTLVDFESKALKGVKTLVIARADQRDGAFTTADFEASYRLITDKAPPSPTIWPQYELVLDGQVTGMGVQSGDRASPDNEFANNLPVPKAVVEVFEVQRGTGLRLGAAVYQKAVGADGRWGPFTAQQGSAYEFVVRAPGYAVTHIYRSPFLRGSALVHLRASRISDADLPAFSITELQRHSGRLDTAVRHITFDGQSPPPAKVTLTRLQYRAIEAEIHTDRIERVSGRTWPAKESHVARLELTQ
ncbi:MAG: twin-arginine translocation pathway signal [Comamonadaceae bacterium]|nr:twin-arginine translocation pathway signal [Comamonadaceae bacterium]